jgi:hypothetical protein
MLVRNIKIIKFYIENDGIKSKLKLNKYMWSFVGLAKESREPND